MIAPNEIAMETLSIVKHEETKLLRRLHRKQMFNQRLAVFINQIVKESKRAL